MCCCRLFGTQDVLSAMTELELTEFLPQLQEYLAELSAVPEAAGGDEGSGDDVEVIDDAAKADDDDDDKNDE